jgi:hemoglobin-like flavoprotein
MDINESTNRILERGESLADLFYQVFFERYPDARKHFQSVNLKHQAVLLTMALLVIGRHFMGSYPATEMYLKYLGTKHRTRGIPPELYPQFRDALLVTLERFHGNDWSEGLTNQWTEAIDGAIEKMLDGYKQHYSV